LSCADGRFVDAAATCTLNSLFAHAQRRAAVQAHNRPSCARSHGFTSIVAGRGRCSRLDSLPSCLCCRAPGVRAGAATSRLRHHALDTHRRATGWTDGVGAGGRTAISGGSVAAAETRGRRPARRCRAGAQVGTDCMRALNPLPCAFSKIKPMSAVCVQSAAAAARGTGSTVETSRTVSEGQALSEEERCL
jgi:hypothetical protein